MAELKTTLNDGSVDDFIDTVQDPVRRDDCVKIIRIMQDVTGEPPKMWGAGIVGFGSYHYKYASGREGDWFLTGFSPRKKDLTLYIMSGFKKSGALMNKLGKYKTGKACLYIKSMTDINEDVLKELIGESIEHLNNLYG
jgi:hypothetical protein